jgi:tRNA1(Val) A37 N6-methylase TrmN6
VLVQGIKGSNAPVELRPGLVLHDAGNRFRPEAEAILRQGAGLSLRNRPVRP